MMLRAASQSNNSSKDAMTFAPYFRSAKNFDGVYVADIVCAVSVFLYIIKMICRFNVLSCIISLICLSIIIRDKDFIREKQRAGITC